MKKDLKTIYNGRSAREKAHIKNIMLNSYFGIKALKNGIFYDVIVVKNYILISFNIKWFQYKFSTFSKDESFTLISSDGYIINGIKSFNVEDGYIVDNDDRIWLTRLSDMSKEKDGILLKDLL